MEPKRGADDWSNPAESQIITDEISAICNSLGKLDENDGTYMRDRDCKACLKEMIRYLGSNSKRQEARLTLGSLNVIKSDLIPLLVQYCDFNDGDMDLFGIILKLCVNLTSQARLFFENQDVPTEPAEEQLHNKLVEYLQRYKQAFAYDDAIWSTLNTHLRHNTDEEITFERIIILIRNILQIESDTKSKDGLLGTGYSTHDMCLNHMEKSGLLNTIIHIASGTQFGTEFCFHITEIIYFMLRDQNPKTLAIAKFNQEQGNVDQRELERKRYLEVAERDRRERRAKNKNLKASYAFKHTAFEVRNVRGLGDAPLIVRKPLDCRESITFDAGKVELRKAKNKKPLPSETSMLSSDKNDRNSRFAYSLKLFCKQFLEKVYANYMQQIKHNLIQKKAQDEDEGYYLWAIQFFTSFNRHANLPMDNISENLATSTLHYIQILITCYLDKLKIEKKKFHQDSSKLHLALRAYREILLLIQSIDKESEFYNTAESIQRKIFSEVEYTTLLLNMFQQYNEPKHSTHYLNDLIQTNSVFLEILQEYSSKHAPVENPEEVSNVKTKKRKRKLDFRAANFTMKYCCPLVIIAHLNALENFKTNDEATNMAILKMFEGIAFDCDNEVMLFQASIFRCLLEIMKYDSSLPGYDRFHALGKHLMERFGSMANKRRWMFQELLFCKTFGDAMEIQDAIDPPAVIPDADERLNSPPLSMDGHGSQEKESQNASGSNTPARNTPPSSQEIHNDSLADLLDELRDSDDDDDNDGGGGGGGGSRDDDEIVGGGGASDDDIPGDDNNVGGIVDDNVESDAGVSINSNGSQPQIENPDVLSEEELIQTLE